MQEGVREVLVSFCKLRHLKRLKWCSVSIRLICMLQFITKRQADTLSHIPQAQIYTNIPQMINVNVLVSLKEGANSEVFLGVSHRSAGSLDSKDHTHHPFIPKSLDIFNRKCVLPSFKPNCIIMF